MPFVQSTTTDTVTNPYSQVTKLQGLGGAVMTAPDGAVAEIYYSKTTGLSANQAATNTITPPVAGVYRITATNVQTATGTSSVLPTFQFGFNDADSGNSKLSVAGATNNTNTVGTQNSASVMVSAGTGAAITWATVGGTYAGMTYNTIVVVECL